MTSKKKKIVAKRHHPKVHRHKPKSETVSSPEFMVQISDPKMVRKEVLESLKEAIIFMQGYEKFRAVQQEKVVIFNELKSHISGLNDLNNKLKKYLPKGNLPVNKAMEPVSSVEDDETEEEEEEKVIPAPKRDSELDELESNLRDIEKQLQKIE